MMFGVIVGTYSSIFIAAPVLIYLGVKVGAEAQAADPTTVPATKAAKPAR